MIICVDHCTDNTIRVVEDFIKENKLSEVKICLIENDNAKGKLNALNKIFSVSSGELFCVVDDDVVLEEKCLINLIGEFITQKNLRCVFFIVEKITS